jgi:hypothetical protein
MRYTHPVAAATKSEYGELYVQKKNLPPSHCSEVLIPKQREERLRLFVARTKKLEKGNLLNKTKFSCLLFVRTLRYPSFYSHFLNSSLSIPRHPSSIPTPRQRRILYRQIRTLAAVDLFDLPSVYKKRCREDPEFFCQCPPRGSKLIVLEPSKTNKQTLCSPETHRRLPLSFSHFNHCTVKWEVRKMGGRKELRPVLPLPLRLHHHQKILIIIL